MHDVNYRHRHELRKHDFLGCCKDCQRSLAIIKPHIMAFAARIGKYDTAALKALHPDDLYRLFCFWTIWRTWTRAITLPS